jgi:hypothetical protein
VDEDDEWPDEESGGGESDETLPCPECGRPVYEDAEKCPHCGAWVTPGAGKAMPAWMKVGAALALLVVALWILGWISGALR